MPLLAPFSCDYLCVLYFFIRSRQSAGDLQYCKLPKDIKELQPYFADLLANKPLSIRGLREVIHDTYVGTYVHRVYTYI